MYNEITCEVVVVVAVSVVGERYGIAPKFSPAHIGKLSSPRVERVDSVGSDRSTTYLPQAFRTT